ncbi:hypothetical protein DFP73DRAFT_599065 [Morchella snyderi]|nr:hypothetical protein DFP73DRAFT_599065 [Morchella snyderi]
MAKDTNLNATQRKRGLPRKSVDDAPPNNSIRRLTSPVNPGSAARDSKARRESKTQQEDRGNECLDQGRVRRDSLLTPALLAPALLAPALLTPSYSPSPYTKTCGPLHEYLDESTTYRNPVHFELSATPPVRLARHASQQCRSREIPPPSPSVTPMEDGNRCHSGTLMHALPTAREAVSDARRPPRGSLVPTVFHNSTQPLSPDHSSVSRGASVRMDCGGWIQIFGLSASGGISSQGLEREEDLDGLDEEDSMVNGRPRRGLSYTYLRGKERLVFNRTVNILRDDALFKKPFPAPYSIDQSFEDTWLKLTSDGLPRVEAENCTGEVETAEFHLERYDDPRYRKIHIHRFWLPRPQSSIYPVPCRISLAKQYDVCGWCFAAPAIRELIQSKFYNALAASVIGFGLRNRATGESTPGREFKLSSDGEGAEDDVRSLQKDGEEIEETQDVEMSEGESDDDEL